MTMLYDTKKNVMDKKQQTTGRGIKRKDSVVKREVKRQQISHRYCKESRYFREAPLPMRK